MTARDLKQYYYLGKEIEYEKQRLAELEMAIAPEAELDETRRVIECKITEAEISKGRILREIMEIDDAFLRQIFVMRHVDLLSWAAIATRIGGDNTPDGVRMAHDRYIKAHNAKPTAQIDRDGVKTEAAKETVGCAQTRLYGDCERYYG